MNSYRTLDISRWIMSLLVIAIHVNVFFPADGVIGKYLFEDLTGVAVPFFFITSGFFFCESGGRNNISRYIEKLGKAYMKWTIIYMPLTILYYYSRGENIAQIIWNIIWRFVFVGENYYSFHLWYVHALIWSVLLYVFTKNIINKTNIARNNTNLLLVIAFSMFVVGRGISFFYSHSGLISPLTAISKIYMQVFITTRNGIFVGFCYFMIGIFLSENKNSIETVSKEFCWLILIISAVLNHYGVFFLLPIEVSCLWILIYNSRISVKRETRFWRKSSVANYYIHMYPVSMLFLVHSTKLSFTSAFLISAVFTIGLSLVCVLKKEINLTKGK